MPPFDLLLPFFIASAIFACIPGPGMFYAAAQTMALGRRAGWYSAAGFHLAGLCHIAAAAFGISVILQMAPVLFVVMKIAGGLYLIWLGISYWRGRSLLAPHGNPAPNRSAGKALRDSIVVEVLNPKSALFYFAFLPQFADASAELPVWMQIVILGMIVNVMFTATDAALIELFHASMRVIKASKRTMLVLQRIGGSILIALGINLVFARPN